MFRVVRVSGWSGPSTRSWSVSRPAKASTAPAASPAKGQDCPGSPGCIRSRAPAPVGARVVARERHATSSAAPPPTRRTRTPRVRSPETWAPGLKTLADYSAGTVRVGGVDGGDRSCHSDRGTAAGALLGAGPGGRPVGAGPGGRPAIRVRHRGGRTGAAAGAARQRQGGRQISFGVATVGVGGEHSTIRTHRLTLKLSVRDRARGGSSPEISDTETGSWDEE